MGTWTSNESAHPGYPTHGQRKIEASAQEEAERLEGMVVCDEEG